MSNYLEVCKETVMA